MATDQLAKTLEELSIAPETGKDTEDSTAGVTKVVEDGTILLQPGKRGKPGRKILRPHLRARAGPLSTAATDTDTVTGTVTETATNTAPTITTDTATTTVITTTAATATATATKTATDTATVRDNGTLRISSSNTQLIGISTALLFSSIG
jgi:hypothetical protein